MYQIFQRYIRYWFYDIVLFCFYKDKQQDIDVPIYSPTNTTNNCGADYSENNVSSKDLPKSKKYVKPDANDVESNSKLSSSSLKEVTVLEWSKWVELQYNGVEMD